METKSNNMMKTKVGYWKNEKVELWIEDSISCEIQAFESLFEISRWVNVRTEKFEFEIINGTEAVDQFFQMIASISTIFFSRTNNFAQKIVAKGRFFHCICLSFNSYSIQSHLCIRMFSVLIFAFRRLHTIFNCSFTDSALAFEIWHTFNVTFDSIRLYHLHVAYVQHFYLKLISSIRFSQLIWHGIRWYVCCICHAGGPIQPFILFCDVCAQHKCVSITLVTCVSLAFTNENIQFDSELNVSCWFGLVWNVLLIEFWHCDLEHKCNWKNKCWRCSWYRSHLINCWKL